MSNISYVTKSSIKMPSCFCTEGHVRSNLYCDAMMYSAPRYSVLLMYLGFILCRSLSLSSESRRDGKRTMQRWEKRLRLSCLYQRQLTGERSVLTAKAAPEMISLAEVG